MAKVSPMQGNFSGGEISPLMFGRTNLDRYAASLETCENYVPTIQGGLTRRTGTAFVGYAASPSVASRLERFEFSTEQAYVLEFSNLKIRVYYDNGQAIAGSTSFTAATQANPVVLTRVAHGLSTGDNIKVSTTVLTGMEQLHGREFQITVLTADTFSLQDVNGNNINGTGYTALAANGSYAKIYEITTTYTTAELFELKFAQSADTIFIAHNRHAPAKLERASSTSWTLSDLVFLDGPYLPMYDNSTTSYTLTPTGFAAGASVTLTASSIVPIDDGQGFQTDDIGRHVRMLQGSTWGWGIITARASTTQVTLLIMSSLTSTAAKSTWQLGLWDAYYHPANVTFHEDRLFFSGMELYPQRVDGSSSSDYYNFAPTELDTTVVATNAVSFTLNSSDVNSVKWMTSDEKGLLIGTAGAEWVLKAGSSSEALSATNVSAKPATRYGSSSVAPVQVGKAALFVQRAGRKLREMTYFYDVEGFRCPDLTQIAEHITAGGITQIAYQKEPQSIVWAVRSDGALLGMTYERDQDNLQVGWHRHFIGGFSDADGTPAAVESVAVIPSADGTSEELWLSVKRYINGKTVRTIEYVTEFFEDTVELEDAFFVDCGLTYYPTKPAITGATAANPVVITMAGGTGAIYNGNTVRIDGVLGMTELNGETFTVANRTATTIELSGVNGTGYTAYVSGGEVTRLASTITGLWHLEGETLDVLGDGGVQPSVTVASGSVTLSSTVEKAHIGHGYVSDAKLLRLEAGAQDGTSIGKNRRTNRVGLMLHRTLGLKIGMSFDDLSTITFRRTSDALSGPPPLYSGIVSETISADYDFENQICLRQDQPLPSTILAVMPQLMTQDRG